MPKCPQCENGWRLVEGGLEPCYHCASTGMVTLEEAFADKVNAYALDLAIYIVSERKRLADDPENEGEPWVFHAAENGMKEQDYTQVQMGIEQDRIKQELEKIDLYVLTAMIDLWDTSQVPWTQPKETDNASKNPRKRRANQQHAGDSQAAESEVPF